MTPQETTSEEGCVTIDCSDLEDFPECRNGIWVVNTSNPNFIFVQSVDRLWVCDRGFWSESWRVPDRVREYCEKIYNAQFNHVTETKLDYEPESTTVKLELEFEFPLSKEGLRKLFDYINCYRVNK